MNKDLRSVARVFEDRPLTHKLRLFRLAAEYKNFITSFINKPVAGVSPMVSAKIFALFF